MTRRIFFLLLCVSATGGWGPRGHEAANRAAVRSIPADGPVFLKEFEDWIVKTGPLPDSWRGPSTPYSKAFEDPNHHWYKENFSFLAEIPRNRFEFILKVYDEYLRIKDKEPTRAAWTNVLGTGTLPYAAMENFDRMTVAMRLYRARIAEGTDESRREARYLAQDIAFYVGWLGHYTADGAQPLHNSIHVNGWKGANPKGFTTERSIHGRFESEFVDLVKVTEADLIPLMPAARELDDPFAVIIGHVDNAASHVTEIYELDKEGAFTVPTNRAAAQLVRTQLVEAAALLRDLVSTAWMRSGRPIPQEPGWRGTIEDPSALSNPRFNPATGTVPPDGPPIRNTGGR